MPPIPSPLPTPSTLTLPTLHSLLALYAPTLAHLATTKPQPKPPSAAPDLPALDHLRYTVLPARVRARRASPSAHPQQDATAPPPAPHGWLEKPELEQLMAWKLARGHARPALPALIRSNAPALVRATTAEAFALFAAAVNAGRADPLPALKVLARLRGVGPATASLVLAVGWPGEVPFFADEVLGWLRRGEGGAGGGVGDGGKGKGEKLKYDWKEYGEVWEGVGRVRGRLGGEGEGLSAESVERGAWVVEMLRVEGVERAVRERVDGDGVDGGDGVRSVDGKDGGANFGRGVMGEDSGEAGEVEKGKGKRKAEVEVEKPAKVPRRRRVEVPKVENTADESVPRRSSRNK
ncbi:hypothetical protein MMC11_006676 [Xylographa trunciseda]|nr:hypothetical protein [Xylographa trunciseda]